MRTICDPPCTERLQRIALSLVALLTCGSCSTHGPLANTSDGSPSPEVAPSDGSPSPEVAGCPSHDAARNLLPQCCYGVVLSPVGPDAPCSFTVPESPPDLRYVTFYLNNMRVFPSDVDGGSGFSYDPTTLTVVFTGAPCDSVMSSPQDSHVMMICDCTVCGGCGPPPACIP